MEQIKLQPIGYSEMYELEVVPEEIIGRFVTFSTKDPNKITLFGKNENDMCLGITTINTAGDSDNPTEWVGKYKTGKYNNILMELLSVVKDVYY